MTIKLFFSTFQNFIFHIFILLIISSCENDLKIKIKSGEKRLIVVAEFTSDTIIHTTHLYRSGDLMTGEPQNIVTGANVYITDNVDTFFYKESSVIPGLYQTGSKCYGIGGHIYYLSITNVDIDNDGQMDSFLAQAFMPVPVIFDSLVSKYGLNGDDEQTVNNYAYFKTMNNGPDYVYNFMKINNREIGSIEKRLGTGEINNNEKDYKISKENSPGRKELLFFSLNKDSVVTGDTLTFIGFNINKAQFEFLKAFDNNTNGDIFMDNIFDQLNMPGNLPTNIEPANKAAGYFFVYSISRIRNIFND